MNDKEYMALALELAKKGCGYVSPNPMVGAVIVKDGRIIGQGYHERYGDLHAERNALKHCSESPDGATIYVTLEPCCHHGKQPPCVDAIIEAGISRVVIGSGDPNPLVSGKGIRLLKEHGIQITQHILEEECNRLNEVFFHFIRTKTPYVVMKYAMTMDGKIATYTGASKWITGEEARAHVQTQRHRFSGIMAGIGTILSDDSLLTCRLEQGINPVRIICDSQLRTPLSSRIAATAAEVPTILATLCQDESKHAPYREKGFQILTLPEKNGHINLTELLKQLGSRNIDSILLEGGAELNWSFLEEGLVQKVQTYLAPKLFGGADAKSPVGGIGYCVPDLCTRLKNSVVTKLGDDFLIESEVCH
ncbi:MAG: bifunctional diaminohydroxyphosphoribosylaminopyrimidine deaminase/5-amino-6-(5-phosphoribosylamino)uracil reductase RibD [Clostridiales bacterium]|nr:bifunctional diaminohydroxyphosphoribosylaminopyrimidine deaminase/5-amino-6-(5-phosphoribosylamino)uracil reductase RibD [Clostridiales bacterium]